MQFEKQDGILKPKFAYDLAHTKIIAVITIV